MGPAELEGRYAWSVVDTLERADELCLFEQHRENDGRLKAGERRTDAEVRACSECEVPLSAVEAEDIGGGVGVLVAVRGSEDGCDHSPVRDANPCDLDVPTGLSEEELDRGIEP